MADPLGTALAGGALLLVVLAALPTILVIVALWRIGTALHRIADNQILLASHEANAAPAPPRSPVTMRHLPHWASIAILLGAAAVVTAGLLTLGAVLWQ